MKISFVLTKTINPNDGGVQHTTYKLGRQFTKMGIEVSYISTISEGHVRSDFGKLYYPRRTDNVDGQSIIQFVIDSLEEIKPDIVINQMPYEHELRRSIYNHSKLHNYKFLGCLRNSLMGFNNNAIAIVKANVPCFFHPLVRTALVERIILKRHKTRHAKDLRAIIDEHDYFVLLAPPNRKELEYYVGNYRENKIKVIPNSVPSVSSRIPHKEKVILFVGRLNIKQKRADLIIPLWKQLFLKLPDWKLVVIGSGPYLDAMKQQIKEEGLERISLEGYQSSIDYYPSASIFFMPSAYEGFPNVILEAQSFGCVPVAFNSYLALEWIVNDKKDAVLIEPYDISKMADAIFNIAKNDCIRHQLAENALANAREFTTEKVCEIWLTFFNSLLAE